jgi:hypothetical protein
MVLRRVLPSALVNQNRVVLEGEPSEQLPAEHCYVSPALGVLDGENGDTIEDLPADVYEVPKTTWFLRFGWGREKRPSPSRSIEIKPTENRWFELPDGMSRLKAEILEINRFFKGELELFQDDSGSLVWKGTVEGLGEIETHYPRDYPRGLPRIVLNAAEADKTELAMKISGHHSNVTPAVALVIAIKYFLARRFSNGVVSKPSGSEKA